MQEVALCSSVERQEFAPASFRSGAVSPRNLVMQLPITAVCRCGLKQRNERSKPAKGMLRSCHSILIRDRGYKSLQRFEPPTNEEHFKAATRVVAWVRWIDRGRNSRMLLQYRLFLSAGRSEAAKAAHKYLKPLIRLCQRTRTTPEVAPVL